MKAKLLKKIRKQVKVYKYIDSDDIYFIYTKLRVEDYASKKEVLHDYYELVKDLSRKIYWKEGREKSLKNKKVYKRIK